MVNEAFSFYKGGIWVTTPTSEIDVPKLLELIKSDTYKPIVDRLRAMKSKEDQRELKRTSSDFDYVTIGGLFSTRGKEKITKPSGLMAHDLDDLKNVLEVKEKLKTNKYVHASFVSPSGKGLKVLVKIPIDDKYEGYFLAFANSIGVDIKGIDKSTRDISRACFMSYDPEAYYNPNSEVWTTYYEQTPIVEWEEVELSKDKSRSGFEFREVVKLLREGMSVTDIRKLAATQKVKWEGVVSPHVTGGSCMSWEKWNHDGTHYQQETYKKAMKYVQDHPTTQQKALQSTFTTIPLPEAMRLRKPKEWLIKGIFPTSGIVYVGGPPKCFKSTIAFHLALCCVTGRKFLDHFKIEGVKKVLFIQEENDDDMLEKFGLLARGMDFTTEAEADGLKNIHLSLCNGITIDTYGGRPEMAIARLVGKIEEVKPDVVFFDSAVRMMEGDENKASDVRRLHNTLKEINKSHKILAFLLHHTTKKENVLRGSGDFIAQADVVLMLNSKPVYNGLVFAEIPYNRLAPGNFNKFSFRVSSIDEDREKITGNEIDVDKIWGMVVDEFSSAERAILSEDEEQVWLWIDQTNHRSEFTFGTIKCMLDTWGFKERKLKMILSKFVEQGKLNHEGYGKTAKYTVPTHIDNQIEVEEDDFE